MDFYGKERAFSDALFQDPDSRFRGAPFWAWNCKIHRQLIDEQLQVFKDMGMGGFHIHSRIGLDTEYLGQEFLDDVAYCNGQGTKLGLLTWLYDEDKWPSGFGGGRVTKTDAFRSRYLLFSPHALSDGHHERGGRSGAITKDATLTYLASYKVCLECGRLVSYERLEQRPVHDEEGLWSAYLAVTDTMPWFNNQSYVDTMNPEAIKRFIELTHEKYLEKVGDQFGKTIPSIFTDEPQVYAAETFKRAEGSEEIGLPFTERLADVFKEITHQDLLDVLPEVFWDGRKGNARYGYFRSVSYLFSHSYAKTLGDWCRKHGIMLAGHLMKEPTLDSQSRTVGETMASYGYFDLPGIDMLADNYEYTTAKQCQSASRQWGKCGCLSELYGVTNWDFDFRHHLTQGGWQAALGVTTRVPHLAWMQMGGESKRDYPAALDFHSPWYKEYKTIEDHFARVATAMTRGKALTKIGVIHPVESYWTLMGPDDQDGKTRKQLDRHFQELTEGLLFHDLDFDFIAESTLPELFSPSEEHELHIGQGSYAVVVVPDCLTLRGSTVDALTDFVKRGGSVVFLGRIPSLIEGLRKDLPEELLAKSRHLPFSIEALCDVLEPWRLVAVKNPADGSQAPCTLTQLRGEDNGDEWLFVTHGKWHVDEEVLSHPDDPHYERLQIAVKGSHLVELYDTMTGGHHPVPCWLEDGCTCFYGTCYAQGSLLYRLREGTPSTEKIVPVWDAGHTPVRYLPALADYSLSEDNALVLDMPKWELEDEGLEEREEILRLDNLLRTRFGYAKRNERLPQPWLSPLPPGESRKLKLVYQFASEVEAPVDFAYEDSPLSISLNGMEADLSHPSWFVDRAIHRIHLGTLKKGGNEITVVIAFNQKTNLENCFLLGRFGVEVKGDACKVVPLPEKLGYGDYSRQGLAFYGGNVTYKQTFEVGETREYFLEVPHYQAPLLHVWVDGADKGPLFQDPQTISLGVLEKGVHQIEICSYGSRINLFGQLHNAWFHAQYWGPDSWRTRGDRWSYTYRLRETGVSSQPLILA